ncbi:MAG: leucine-rich repeat protein [Acutalibacteraceae bacterium]
MNFTKFSRKIVAAALAVCMTVGCAVTGVGSYTGLSTTVNAAESTAEAPASDFEYYYTQTDGTVKITKYNGTAENVVIPSKINGKDVTIIGSVFLRNKTVKSVVIPNTVKEIGTQAFDECSELTSVYIPNSVVKIRRMAFNDCTKLQSVTIPDSVLSLSDNVFYGCTSLATINGGNNLEIIENGALSNTLWERNLPDGIVYVGKVAYNYRGSMPENAKITLKDGITCITGMAFFGCSNMAEITIPSSVKTIGKLAFYGCSGLKSVTIPENVESIGEEVFTDCQNLGRIDVNSNNKYYTSVDGVLFNKDKTKLVQCPGNKTGAYTIPNGVTELCRGAFSYCEKLTSISIPEGVTLIGQEAFRDTIGLTSITIPDSVEEIDNHAFWSCDNLKSVNLGKGIQRIGYYAFERCESLESIKFPDSLTTISQNAFDCCYKLKSVYIPQNVKSIGSAAFARCESLERIDVNPNNTYYLSSDGVLFDKNKTTLLTCPAKKTGEYTVPKSVTKIYPYAFSRCAGLTKITLPEGITEIRDYTFDSCTSLTNIDLPTGVSKIGGYAFISCKNLKSIVIPDSVTSIDNDAFFICYATIYGNENSQIQKYAKQQNLPFIVIPVNNSSISSVSVTIGDTVTLNASAVNGATPYSYAYLYKKTSDTSWTTAQNYSSALSFAFKPTSSGTYKLCVKAKDSNGVERDKIFTLTVNALPKNNSTISKTTINKGDSVTITGKAANGTTPYQYSFLCKHSTETKWTTLTSYGTTSTRVWQPKKTGTYTVRTKVKDATGKEAVKNFTLTVNTVLVNNSTISKKTIDYGNSVTITGKATEGTTPYQYSFLCKHSTATSWTTLTSYGTTSTRVWQPKKTGTYTIRTKVRDSKGKETIKDFTLTVNPALVNKSTITSTTINKGDAITLKGVATGGTLSYKYSFLCKHSSATSWTTLTSYGTTSTRVWQPKQLGTYTVRAKVKDATGNEVIKDFKLTVKSTLANNSTISSTSIKYGDALTITGKAANGTSPYKYSFLCKHSTETKWTTLTSYGTTSKRVWQPKKTGTYTVRTKVKDADGAEVIKDFQLIVKSTLANNSTISKTSINYGDAITITGKASGGKSPYQYTFLCKHSTATSWTTLTSYGTTSTRVWKPTKSGIYSVHAKVKDSSGAEVIKNFVLMVK